MKTYREPDGSLWAFEEDGSQDLLITPDMVYLTPAQVAALPAIFIAPTSVTPLQAKRALNKAGLMPQVQAAISAADIDTQLAWTAAASFDRHSPFILNMGAVLGLTSAQIDALFISAATFT